MTAELPPVAGGAAAERERLAADDRREARWRRWGPYLSDRQWGTVREDYSADGDAWNYFPFEQARSRAYRWGEDGLLGLCDNHQRLCFALALWNGRDPFLKERLFGLAGPQGNHGEDVKEIYIHRDSTPSHSWMKALYRYPHGRFPYEDLIEENGRRGRDDPEYELLDTGIFTDDRFCDVEVEYAKQAPDDILIRLRVTNRGPDPHTLHLLPTLWFRNTWSWGGDDPRPSIRPAPPAPDAASSVPWLTLAASHPAMGAYWLHAERLAAASDGSGNAQPELLVTDNDTNARRLFGVDNPGPYVKDGINDRVVAGDRSAVHPEGIGTKASLLYELSLAAGETRVLRLRLVDQRLTDDPLGAGFDAVVLARQREADAFYADLIPAGLPSRLRELQRQAFAGLLWTKQTYLYVIRDWLAGDPVTPPPPEHRHGRNHQWQHFHADDVLSMPDGWEYPWFAAWDLAFHCVPLALVDPGFAKHQLDLLTREWYMHPNGQLPAYEWAFDDVNPPVHAWATWQVYSMEKRSTGKGDRAFLERVFQKLLLNFTWWVNRKDAEGNNIFQGGFLGLDNIGVFDRSAPLPTGGFIEQADGTSWMGMFCLNMLTISLELALENPVYEDMATKFFEHFLYIAAAMNAHGSGGNRLWDEADGFFYDVLHLPDGQRLPLKIRSMVGLIPLFAIAILEPDVLDRLPAFKQRLEWFIQHRPDLKVNVACMETRGRKARRLLALTYLSPNRFVAEDRFRRILERLFDPAEFLSGHGIRSLSRHHADHPYVFSFEGQEHRVGYEPAESRSGLFGGNSNWRGPVWFPVNHLLIEALHQFHRYAGDDFQVECPTGSGRWLSLQQAADLLTDRLIGLFLPADDGGPPPAYGPSAAFLTDAEGRPLHLFHEYFHGDDGTGLGASHQTGWTGLVAQLIQDRGTRSVQPPR
ncbi:glucosidase [Synechococcus sp. CCY 9618]|uniref:MGH1-like glycoside hydrolase domain-containing protein n=1 Tax=Synechococcus sp. CCY 9618 TaxID=2815602 RepID=UPI001C218271|nr:glucosidase [Synechococcus sp. CCY 9618]